MTRLTLLLITCGLLLPGSAFTATRLALHWQPQAQFAGFYVAEDKGFYREAGLDLTILHGGTDSVPADRLSSGEAHFATMFLATALVNVCQLVQRSSLLLLTRKKDAIDTVADLDGRRVAVWANEFQLQPWALFRQHDIEPLLVPFSGSMELFLKEAVSATMAMWYNEYHTVLASGYREEELQPFFFKDTAFDFPEDGIYCLAETVDNDPETVAAIVDATLRGWRYAFAHEDEALAITKARMRAANLPFSLTHQRWMLRTITSLIAPPDGPDEFGQLSRRSFEPVAAALLQAGFTDRLPSYEVFVRSGDHAD